MRRHIEKYLVFFLAIGFLAACSATADDAPDGEMAEGDEMAEPADMAEGSGAMASQDALSCFLRGATPEEAANRPSPLREVRFSYEGGEGLLCHGAPSARGREIMGGLVPYGELWRAGANEPTTFHLSAPTTIGGVSLDAGSYAMYALPGESEWEFFLNSSSERWGIPISDDVRTAEIGSFTVTPTSTDEMVETLTYTYENGHIVMTWENTRLEIPVGGM